MEKNVHCFSAEYDKSRFSHPIVQKKLPADRVVLFIDSTQADGDNHDHHRAELVESIESQTNIEIEKIRLTDSIDNSYFQSIYQIIYQKLYEEIEKDNHLWLNISSEPHIVNFCFLHAISSLQLNPGYHRAQIHIYQTTGEPIYNELHSFVQTVSKQSISIENTVDRQSEILKDLRVNLKNLDIDGQLEDGNGELFDLLTELEMRIQDIERNSLSERASKLAQEIDEHGMTGIGSVRTLPHPPSGKLGDYERELLITLGAMDNADSISELIDKLLILGLQDIEGSLLHHLEMDAEETFDQYQESLASGIRSTVQNNINSLVRKGYISKEKHGRSRRIELKENGILWLITRGHNLGDDPDTDQLHTDFERLPVDLLQRFDIPLGE